VRKTSSFRSNAISCALVHSSATAVLYAGFTTQHLFSRPLNPSPLIHGLREVLCYCIVCERAALIRLSWILCRYLQQRVFEPLRMVDTSFWVPPHKRHRFADVYAESPSRPAGKSLINVSTSVGQLGYIGKEAPVFSSGGGGLVRASSSYTECIVIANIRKIFAKPISTNNAITQKCQ
jgi:hypothetical protein